MLAYERIGYDSTVPVPPGEVKPGPFPYLHSRPILFQTKTKKNVASTRPSALYSKCGEIERGEPFLLSSVFD